MSNDLRLHPLRYWRGRWRLRHGYCPECNSSPPLRSCSICSGSYNYGPFMHEGLRRNWRRRWDALHD